VKETLVCHGLDQYILYIDEAFPSKTVTLGLGWRQFPDVFPSISCVFLCYTWRKS